MEIKAMIARRRLCPKTGANPTAIGESVRPAGRAIRAATLAMAGGLLAAHPAAATTIVIDALVANYHSTTPDGVFRANDGSLHGAPLVGHLADSGAPPADGYYATIVQFALPTLPAGALVTSATLGFGASVNPAAGDVAFRGYVTPSSGLDPANVYGGTDLGVIRLSATNAFDVSWLIGVDIDALPSGWNAGFSFRQISDSCFVPSISECQALATIGGPDPTLSITYDVAPPPPTVGVPESPTWLVLLAGFSLLGLRMRRRRAPNRPVRSARRAAALGPALGCAGADWS
jgi:hypothetical protein